MNPSAINSIEPLSGNNFKKWKRDLEIVLGLLDINLALKEEKLAALTSTSTREQKLRHEKWENSNTLCLLIMEKTITEAIFGGIPTSENAKEFLASVSAKFMESEKAETGNLMSKLTTMKYKGVGGIREYILSMVDVATKLNSLKIPIVDPYLVHLILNSLPSQYEQLKIIYNALKEKWDVNELISVCVQEEERINKEKETHSVHLTINAQKRRPFKGTSHTTNKEDVKPNPLPKTHALGVNQTNNPGCYFCNKLGHLKRNCNRYKRWAEKRAAKGNSNMALVCFESNSVSIPSNSWILDSGSSIHVANSLQDFISQKTPNRDQVQVVVGNGKRVRVHAIGTVRLYLDSGFCLELNDVVYVPSMRRNLISVSKLVKSKFKVDMHEFGFDLFLNSIRVGNGLIVDEMFQLTHEKEKLVLNVETIGQKRPLTRDSSSRLWHKRLGHISRERMQRLVKEEILPPLDFTDYGDYIECIKGKMTNSRKLGSTRSSHLLEIIHTDICGPFPIETLEGHRYFITFIDDYSRFCYLYLIPTKSTAFEVFKVFKTEVENQLDLKIKVVRSDRGGEYYGKYDEQGRHPAPFARYLQDCGIVAQYTHPGTPEQNGVAERRNRTLKDMVRSMICNIDLPKFL